MAGTRHRMGEKLLSIGDEVWIDTDDDRHAFREKKLRIRETMELERGETGAP
jgi:uncharacterized protein YxjI